MLKRIFKYIGSRAVGPIGMLLQISLLARWLPHLDFNIFLQLYATAVVTSVISDAGQRNRLFVALRHGYSHEEEQHHVSNAARIKFSATVLMTMTAALCVAIGGRDGVPTALALLIGIVNAAADINLTVVRAKLRPNTETAVVSVENAAVVVSYVLLHALNLLSAVTAAGAIVVIGAARATTTVWISRVKFGFTPHLLPEKNSLWQTVRENYALLRASIPATLGLASAQLFNRYPALSLSALLAPKDYAVFIAFLTLLLRGQLVVNAVLQAGYRSAFPIWRKYLASARGMFILGIALAVPVELAIVPFPHLAALAYVGKKLAGSYRYDVYAAGFMLLCYPLCASQQALQLASRNLVVAVGAVLGVIVQFALEHAMHPHGPEAVIPYGAGLVVYTAVCGFWLWFKVPPDQL